MLLYVNFCLYFEISLLLTFRTCSSPIREQIIHTKPIVNGANDNMLLTLAYIRTCIRTFFGLNLDGVAVKLRFTTQGIHHVINVVLKSADSDRAINVTYY